MSNLKLLPEYPHTSHLPYKPNTSRGDLIASEDDVACIFTSERVTIEDKVDGANSGMALVNGHAIIRNRNHILKKGFKKNTPAKEQFNSIWNWFYKNKAKFEQLESEFPGLSVYGEWALALHGLNYDQLPDLFIAYDLYDQESHQFLDPLITRQLLEKAKFAIPQLLHAGKVGSWEQLAAFCEEKSAYSTTDKREGVYVKVGDGKYTVKRYKMVRTGFTQGGSWNKTKLRKNTLQIP